MSEDSTVQGAAEEQRAMRQHDRDGREPAVDEPDTSAPDDAEQTGSPGSA